MNPNSKLIQIDKMTEGTLKRLQKYAGVSNIFEMVALAKAEGAKLGRGEVTQQVKAAQFYINRYNSEILIAREQVAAAKLQAAVEEARKKVAVKFVATQKKEKARKKARQAKRASVKSKVFIYTTPFPSETIFNYISSQAGKTIRVVADQFESENQLNLVTDVPAEMDLDQITTKYRWIFMRNSDFFIWQDDSGDIIDGKLTVYTASSKAGKAELQSFKDGISHCVFTPIRKWIIEKFNEAKSASAKSRFNAMKNRLASLEEKYAQGVPEHALSEVANSLTIDIEVEKPFCDEPFVRAESSTKRLKLFKFVNTRMHHVEHNEVTTSSEQTILTVDKMQQLYDKLRKDNAYFTFKRKSTTLSQISTINGLYVVDDPFRKCVEEFEEMYNIKACRVDDMADFELSSFIKEGSNYNETVDFKYLDECTKRDSKHIDMKRAYANFKTCKYYEGFLGRITDFRQCNKIEAVGLYRITNLSLDKCSEALQRLNKKMKIWFSNNVYASAELTMLKEAGAEYKIVSGCWGCKPLDFEFTQDMLEQKDNGVSYYAKWAGCIDSHDMRKRFYMHCDEKFFNVVQHNTSAQTAQKFADGIAMFSYDKKSNMHAGHITAFLTSYQRLNVVEQLLTMDLDKVVRVCVDGIYYLGEDPTLCNVFRKKTQNVFSNKAMSSYVSVSKPQPLQCPLFGGPRELHEPREHHTTEIHLGEGGCGKTHFNLRDKGLVRPLFIAPSWKLANDKKNNYEASTSVWARALSSDPIKWKPIADMHNVLIVDEVSMLSEEQKQILLSDRFSGMKLIFCGDIGYQLPCIEGKPMTLDNIEHVVKYDTDHRCKDESLRAIKKELRELIDKKISVDQMKNWVTSTFKKFERCVAFDDVVEMYGINDMILAGTHELKDRYTKALTGKFSQEKYFVTETSRKFSNGEIVIGDKPETKCQIQHAFTTHSIQGETAEHNLFIHAERMFDLRMFYTAISRARKLSQIFIVIDTTPPLSSYIFKYLSLQQLEDVLAKTPRQIRCEIEKTFGIDLQKYKDEFRSCLINISKKKTTP